MRMIYWQAEIIKKAIIQFDLYDRNANKKAPGQGAFYLYIF